MSGYGRIVTGKQVRDQVRDHCKLWLPYYLAEMDRVSGRPAGSLPVPSTWEPALRSAPSDYQEGQLPVGVVVAPGLADEPVKRGGGVYEATWSVGVGIIVSGQDRDNTLELAELYAAAVRTLTVQHRSLALPDDGGTLVPFATTTEWVNERYDDLDDADLRTLAAAIVQFYVTVDNVTDARQGLTQVPAPEVPVTAPMPEPATVVAVEVTALPLEDQP